MRAVRTGALLLAFVLLLPGCVRKPGPEPARQPEVVDSMRLDYATQFAVDYLADGSALVTIEESGRYLVAPEGQDVTWAADGDITVLRQPVANIYLAATSAMCLFDALDALGSLSMSGVKADGWYIENARAAMERGEIVYAGKYSAPDYELMLELGCELAIESTMIDHAPEVKEKLLELGVPVLTERSSYEPHPLGRTEWIKLYGLLTGKEELAARLFEEQAAILDTIPEEPTGKTVAFFHISSNGSAVVRKSGDYVTKMIELAGGEYAFTDVGDDLATGTANLTMERFYAETRDADVIIYNSSIDGEIPDLAALLGKSGLLADMKAVQTGNVWCTSQNLFQETTGFGLLIADMRRVFTEEPDSLTDLNYLYRLR